MKFNLDGGEIPRSHISEEKCAELGVTFLPGDMPWRPTFDRLMSMSGISESDWTDLKNVIIHVGDGNPGALAVLCSAFTALTGTTRENDTPEVKESMIAAAQGHGIIILAALKIVGLTGHKLYSLVADILHPSIPDDEKLQPNGRDLYLITLATACAYYLPDIPDPIWRAIQAAKSEESTRKVWRRTGPDGKVVEALKRDIGNTLVNHLKTEHLPVMSREIFETTFLSLL